MLPTGRGGKKRDALDLCEVTPREHVQERRLPCHRIHVVFTRQQSPAGGVSKKNWTTNRMRHLHIRLPFAVPVGRTHTQTIIKTTVMPHATPRHTLGHGGELGERTGLPLPKDGLVDDEPHNGIGSDSEEVGGGGVCGKLYAERRTAAARFFRSFRFLFWFFWCHATAARAQIGSKSWMWMRNELNLRDKMLQPGQSSKSTMRVLSHPATQHRHQ